MLMFVFIGNYWLTMRAFMIYRTIWAIYRHVAVVMSTLAFWLSLKYTASERCWELCVREQSIYTRGLICANWKGTFWISSNIWIRLEAEILSQKQKQTGWETATMTVWQPIGPICLFTEDVRVWRVSCPHTCASGRYTELTWCGRHE